MGTSDDTASPGAATVGADSVDAVHTDTITHRTADAERLRNALVDQLCATGHARTSAVEAALRTVPRHVFVPGASLEDAYANAPVHIKYDTDGTSLSCASQPSVVALMLDQLDVRPGERVLEVGAGTGYNAGLLAHLVGESGHVTTLDVDDDLVEGARAHLAAAGITNVEAVTRDGALGHAEGAPYDRIVATVGAHGVPHAWLRQLAPGGWLLVPQRLKGTVSRSIAYERRDGRWVSLGSEMNTFMPLRRGIADDERRVIPLSADGTVRLQAPAGQCLDADALAGVLDRPRTEVWTGMTVRAMESPEWMELFLTCSLPSGLIRLLFPQSAKGTLLTEDPYPSSTAAVDKGAVTYLARRESEARTPEGGKLWEFGVIGHGPGSDELAARVADTIRTWDRAYRGREATFEIRPLDAPAIAERPGLFVLDTPLNRIVVDWQQHPTDGRRRPSCRT
ncbi:protein-L-isoaspartate(D-aspartate) O-methyltransferase [Streptomyces sp. Amel2xC10]|nr:protein-L-isoaspartate(D-aspartate) O-methyltransferase [Streptomyces sp. Amel2xC10]